MAHIKRPAILIAMPRSMLPDNKAFSMSAIHLAAFSFRSERLRPFCQDGPESTNMQRKHAMLTWTHHHPKDASAFPEFQFVRRHSRSPKQTSHYSGKAVHGVLGHAGTVKTKVVINITKQWGMEQMGDDGLNESANPMPR